MGLLYLEDGNYFEGKPFGANKLKVGELVFNTSMSGYQSMLTDPSYFGQIILLTYPLIGNYGISKIDYQSEKIHAFGLIAKDISFKPSNSLSTMTIDQWLKLQKIAGLYDIDTRKLTKLIRKNGTMKALISSEDINISEAKKFLTKTILRDDYMKVAGTKTIKTFGEENKKHIAIYDFGIKMNIIESFIERNFRITLFPYGSTAEEILSINPDGIFLSNGPGNPKEAYEAISEVKKIIGKKPIFGICMGHQILSLALGLDTYKLKFGHRGANHGVYEIKTDRSVITSQNHSFAVDPDSIKKAGLENIVDITHYNLNDNTVEGIRHRNLPLFSVQYHPEGSPGPDDSNYLFDEFIREINK
ncbi:MAG: glutamine-hydrolyzing carbamoyl-phosphate synthase small subunit [Clostridiales Family XIII bacterium]|jgi:carbamoyl-phosphate synthase small subunit|nr:glutamine-hydrolyzing carbamoyl-phosphate synthase small subunit [Clostridiales Family XIII bacterium]